MVAYADAQVVVFQDPDRFQVVYTNGRKTAEGYDLLPPEAVTILDRAIEVREAEVLEAQHYPDKLEAMEKLLHSTKKPFTGEVVIYLHNDKALACVDGLKAGLNEKQLENFRYAGYEVKLTYRVEEDGTPILIRAEDGDQVLVPLTKQTPVIDRCDGPGRCLGSDTCNH